MPSARAWSPSPWLGLGSWARVNVRFRLGVGLGLGVGVSVRIRIRIRVRIRVRVRARVGPRPLGPSYLCPRRFGTRRWPRALGRVLCPLGTLLLHGALLLLDALLSPAIARSPPLCGLLLHLVRARGTVRVRL